MFGNIPPGPESQKPHERPKTIEQLKQALQQQLGISIEIKSREVREALENSTPEELADVYDDLCKAATEFVHDPTVSPKEFLAQCGIRALELGTWTTGVSGKAIHLSVFDLKKSETSDEAMDEVIEKIRKELAKRKKPGQLPPRPSGSALAQQTRGAGPLPSETPTTQPVGFEPPPLIEGEMDLNIELDVSRIPQVTACAEFDKECKNLPPEKQTEISDFLKDDGGVMSNALRQTKAANGKQEFLTAVGGRLGLSANNPAEAKILEALYRWQVERVRQGKRKDEVRGEVYGKYDAALSGNPSFEILPPNEQIQRVSDCTTDKLIIYDYNAFLYDIVRQGVDEEWSRDELEAARYLQRNPPEKLTVIMALRGGLGSEEETRAYRAFLRIVAERLKQREQEHYQRGEEGAARRGAPRRPRSRRQILKTIGAGAGLIAAAGGMKLYQNHEKSSEERAALLDKVSKMPENYDSEYKRFYQDRESGDLEEKVQKEDLARMETAYKLKEGAEEMELAKQAAALRAEATLIHEKRLVLETFGAGKLTELREYRKQARKDAQILAAVSEKESKFRAWLEQRKTENSFENARANSKLADGVEELIQRMTGKE